MHTTQEIEFILARHHFEEAENKGLKLMPGAFETKLWLHHEGINLDHVIEIARRFPDARTFIISNGLNKGFYIYSNLKKVCIKLINKSHPYSHAESA
ncbi:MAG: hypothetical protein JXR22_10280 [Prolixibacteraceae bacterium]|nr:hypothetical protein [Prolixibacteraceae bacterium]